MTPPSPEQPFAAGGQLPDRLRRAVSGSADPPPDPGDEAVALQPGEHANGRPGRRRLGYVLPAWAGWELEPLDQPGVEEPEAFEVFEDPQVTAGEQHRERTEAVGRTSSHHEAPRSGSRSVE